MIKDKLFGGWGSNQHCVSDGEEQEFVSHYQFVVFWQGMIRHCMCYLKQKGC